MDNNTEVIELQIGLTSTTMGNTLDDDKTGKEDKNDTSDSTPTSSTDAGVSSASIQSTSDDPISSTSEVLDHSKMLKSLEVCKKLNVESDADLLDIHLSDVSNEKITENVEDIVQDLENLLGESSSSYTLAKHRESLRVKMKDVENVGSDSAADLESLLMGSVKPEESTPLPADAEETSDLKESQVTESDIEFPNNSNAKGDSLHNDFDLGSQLQSVAVNDNDIEQSEKTKDLLDQLELSSEAEVTCSGSTIENAHQLEIREIISDSKDSHESQDSVEIIPSSSPESGANEEVLFPQNEIEDAVDFSVQDSELSQYVTHENNVDQENLIEIVEEPECETESKELETEFKESEVNEQKENAEGIESHLKLDDLIESQKIEESTETLDIPLLTEIDGSAQEILQTDTSEEKSFEEITVNFKGTNNLKAVEPNANLEKNAGDNVKETIKSDEIEDTDSSKIEESIFNDQTEEKNESLPVIEEDIDSQDKNVNILEIKEFFEDTSEENIVEGIVEEPIDETFEEHNEEHVEVVVRDIILKETQDDTEIVEDIQGEKLENVEEIVQETIPEPELVNPQKEVEETILKTDIMEEIVDGIVKEQKQAKTEETVDESDKKQQQDYNEEVVAETKNLKLHNIEKPIEETVPASLSDNVEETVNERDEQQHQKVISEEIVQESSQELKKPENIEGLVQETILEPKFDNVEEMVEDPDQQQHQEVNPEEVVEETISELKLDPVEELVDESVQEQQANTKDVAEQTIQELQLDKMEEQVEKTIEEPKLDNEEEVVERTVQKQHLVNIEEEIEGTILEQQLDNIEEQGNETILEATMNIVKEALVKTIQKQIQDNIDVFEDNNTEENTDPEVSKETISPADLQENDVEIVEKLSEDENVQEQTETVDEVAEITKDVQITLTEKYAKAALTEEVEKLSEDDNKQKDEETMDEVAEITKDVQIKLTEESVKAALAEEVIEKLSEDGIIRKEEETLDEVAELSEDLELASTEEGVEDALSQELLEAPEQVSVECQEESHLAVQSIFNEVPSQIEEVENTPDESSEQVTEKLEEGVGSEIKQVDDSVEIEIQEQALNMTCDQYVQDSIDAAAQHLEEEIQDQTSAAVQSILDNMRAEQMTVADVVAQKDESPLVHSSFSSYELEKAVRQIQDFTPIDESETSEENTIGLVTELQDAEIDDTSEANKALEDITKEFRDELATSGVGVDIPERANEPATSETNESVSEAVGTLAEENETIASKTDSVSAESVTEDAKSVVETEKFESELGKSELETGKSDLETEKSHLETRKSDLENMDVGSTESFEMVTKKSKFEEGEPKLVVGKSETMPDRVELVSEKVELVPDNVELVTDKIELVPEKVELVLEKVELVSDEIEFVSDKIELVSDNVELVSNKVELVPDKIESVSDNVESVSGKVELVLDDVELVPDKVELVSNKVELISENVELVSEKVKPITEKIELVSKTVETVKPEVVPVKVDLVTPDKHELVSEKHELESNKSELVLKSSKLVSDKSKLVPDKSKLVSDKSKLVSDKSKLVSDQSKLVHGKSKLVSDKSKLVPESPKLESNKLNLESEKLVSTRSDKSGSATIEIRESDSTKRPESIKKTAFKSCKAKATLGKSEFSNLPVQDSELKVTKIKETEHHKNKKSLNILLQETEPAASKVEAEVKKIEETLRDSSKFESFTKTSSNVPVREPEATVSKLPTKVTKIEETVQHSKVAKIVPVGKVIHDVVGKDAIVQDKSRPENVNKENISKQESSKQILQQKAEQTSFLKKQVEESTLTITAIQKKDKDHKSKEKESTKSAVEISTSLNEPLSINIDDVDKEKPYSPKITIKPLKPPPQVEQDQPPEERSVNDKVSLKMTITKQSDNTHSILKVAEKDDETSTKIEDQQQSTIPKLVIKASTLVEDGGENCQGQHSPKMSTRSSRKEQHVQAVHEKQLQHANSGANQRSASPRITLKPIVKETSPLKITIKQILQSEETLSNIGKQKHSPKLSIKPIVEETPSPSHNPRVTIKPIVKPAEEPDQPVHSPKITIKPIPRPTDAEPQTSGSGGGSSNLSKNPKITIKPLNEDEVGVSKVGIVLKINKASIPIHDKREAKKREHEEEKSEKLAKIKLKYSKGSEHPHIVHQGEDEDDDREDEVEGVSSKRLKTAEVVEEQSSGQGVKRRFDNPYEAHKKLKTDDDDDDVKIVEDKTNSPIVISEDSTQDSVILVEDVKESYADVSTTNVSTTVSGTATALVLGSPAVQQALPTPPRKRGRPRKVPLEVREDFGTPSLPIMEISSPAASDDSQASPVSESRRPKRSCRGQSVCDTLGIKPRKPKTPGRGRGGKRGRRGGSNTPPMAQPIVDYEKPEKKESKISTAKGVVETPRKSLTEEAIESAFHLAEKSKENSEKLFLDRAQFSSLILPESDAVSISEVKSFKSLQQDVKEFETSSVDVEMQPPVSVVPPPPQISSGSQTPVAEISSANISSSTDIAMFEEETRMSADVGSRAQTPAKQVVTTDLIEESQSSVQSTATTESVKVSRNKVGRLEIQQEPEGSIISADQLAEYYWNGNGPFMIQEQVAQFLGIKSFKRKYPKIARRMVDMQERDFIRESFLASEAMCNLGLTVVSSADILDIMYTDFQEKYEEYCKHQRDRQAKDLINKQKALALAASQEKTKMDIVEQAVHSAASYNQNFNKARREQRRACMDLQTWNVHYPRGRMKHIKTPKLGSYPVALVPGQFTDYYKEFTPTEINNLPLNTMCYTEIHKIGPESDTSDSGSDSDSSSSDSDTESSCGENCKTCIKQALALKKAAGPLVTTTTS